jgi:phosphoserine phosphatase
LCGRFLDIDLVRKSALLLIRNKSLFELKGLAEKFYNDFLKKRVNKQVINLIYKGEGRRIVLMSSSIDVVVNVIASSIGVECYSSELEYRNGLATGRLKTDLTGIKGEVTQHLLTAADSSVELTVITDNKTDWELMRMAQQRYVVVKSSNEKGFWKTLNPIFIEV